GPSRLLLRERCPGLLRALHANGHPVLPAPERRPIGHVRVPRQRCGVRCGDFQRSWNEALFRRDSDRAGSCRASNICDRHVNGRGAKLDRCRRAFGRPRSCARAAGTFPRMLGTILPAMLSFALSARLLGGKARLHELQTVTRGAAHNATTEMDLALWALCTEVRSDPDSLNGLPGREPAALAAAYRD